MTTLRVPSGSTHWRVVHTVVGATEHRGPIEIHESGALILWREDGGAFGSLDPVEVFGVGMWVRAEAT